ncbi:hypothetical protein D9M72_515410 [compost metagenome]
MIENNSAKSERCIGRSLASAKRRPASSSARIISRMTLMRSSSKNMCSVRQRPMPSAPKERAARASAGVSALVLTVMRRLASAQAMILPKSPESSGCSMAIDPFST